MGLFQCSGCGRRFWSDFEYGAGALSPLQIDARSGEARRINGPRWYADMTMRAYSERVSEPRSISVLGDTSIRTGLLLNCLNPWWGDTASLILRTNILKNLNVPIVVLTTKDAAWLIPDYVSQAWIVDMSVSGTAVWNDHLAHAVKDLTRNFDDLRVPPVFQPASLRREEVAALMSVEPFDRERWMSLEPTFGFAWRSDRCWAPPRTLPFPVPGRWRSKLERFRSDERSQLNQMVQCFESVKRAVPRARFICFGLVAKGKPRQALPPWIQDQRVDKVGATENRAWCQAAAKCHVLVGVLGSHMTLPSFHAGSIIDLVPTHMAKLVLTDIGVVSNDPREAIFLYRLLSTSTTPLDLAATIVSIYANAPYARMAFGHDWYRPLSCDDLRQLREMRVQRHTFVADNFSEQADGWIGP
jgi:hypothetical protein